MTTRYHFDPALSRFSVQAFATGMLSFMGHNPTFAVREWSGTVAFGGGRVERMQVAMVVRAESLQLVDDVREADRDEIEGRMHSEVLETARYPEITFQSEETLSEAIAQGRYRVRLAGWLQLHGVPRPLRLDVDLGVFSDGIRLAGECPLRMSDHDIRPVTALAGAIRLKDELRVAWDVAAVPEGP
jgi:polyisoprenoid-binding protein YceI